MRTRGRSKYLRIKRIQNIHPSCPFYPSYTTCKFFRLHKQKRETTSETLTVNPHSRPNYVRFITLTNHWGCEFYESRVRQLIISRKKKVGEKHRLSHAFIFISRMLLGCVGQLHWCCLW